MPSSDIQKKIKAGLSKAVKKTGSVSSDKVYLLSETISSGNNPLDPPTVTKTETLLTNAVFKSHDENIAGENIQAGDRELVSDNDVEIVTGATIKSGNGLYLVVDVEKKAPAGDVLFYISQLEIKA